MKYRQILPDVLVIAWEHVKRLRMHHGYLQTVSMRSRTIFKQRKMRMTVKSIVDCKMCTARSLYHEDRDGIGIFIVEKVV